MLTSVIGPAIVQPLVGADIEALEVAVVALELAQLD
jgi:hypothetical protein